MTGEHGEWKENDIFINGHKLSVGEAMTFRVAVTHFHAWLKHEGLGDDEHALAMVEGYRRNCESMFRKMDGTVVDRETGEIIRKGRS